MENNIDYINIKAAERSKLSTFERTNEFLIKIAMLQGLPQHQRFSSMIEIFRELLIRVTKAELRINELEEELR